MQCLRGFSRFAIDFNGDGYSYEDYVVSGNNPLTNGFEMWEEPLAP